MTKELSGSPGRAEQIAHIAAFGNNIPEFGTRNNAVGRAYPKIAEQGYQCAVFETFVDCWRVSLPMYLTRLGTEA